MANPIQAMGRAIAKIDAFEVPAQPKTTFNVGRVGGGTSVNAIPFEAGWKWIALGRCGLAEAVHTKFKAAREGGGRGREQALEQSGTGECLRRTGRLSARRNTPESDPIVQTALAVSPPWAFPRRA